mmetsp:Transcript_6999/g.10271  ORF Transcript_6999/g.10271 Transcript_6999/m.10271 type:complete len:390 (-) Transcript_6999:235-1404(-)
MNRFLYLHKPILRHYQSFKVQCDQLVIGGGVVGLAIANELAKNEKHQVILVEKNSLYGEETSSRNSEVIHAGLYHNTDMLKSELCQKGNRLLYEHCMRFDVPHRNCGKIIVARDEEQMEELNHMVTDHLNLKLKVLSNEKMQAMEPLIKGYAGVFSPTTGIVDSHELMQSMVFSLDEKENVLLSTDHKVIRIEYHPPNYYVFIETKEDTLCIETPILINSSGLHSEHVLKLFQEELIENVPELLYVKGQYYIGPTNLNISHLIYPMPQKNLKGLGTHLTIDLSGNVKFGPDVHHIGTFSDHYSNLNSYYHVSNHLIDQVKDSIESFLNVSTEKLQANYAGIRPKLVHPDGKVSDFFIKEVYPGFVHLTGIESPGLTSSLAIAEFVKNLL